MRPQTVVGPLFSPNLIGALAEDFMADFDDLLLTDLREHVYGLGLVSLRYNMFESALRFILSNYAEPAVVDLLFEKSSNEQRTGAIRFLANIKEKDPQVTDHVDHLLIFFSICAENRNILMHSRQSWTFQPEEGSLALEKRLKAGGKNIYQLDLPTLKRVANDMIKGVTYLIEVDKLSRESLPPERLLAFGWQRTMPEKPPLPDKLNPHRPVVNLQADPSQPRS
jgi:hypothetical protein